MDTLLDLADLSPPVTASGDSPGPAAPRPYLPHHLPDGTPLRLTAGIIADLASIYHDDFTSYLPNRFDEWAVLLWMATRPASEHGAAWRDPREARPPLLADFPALRATVSRWIDDTFCASEADYIRRLALGLWTREHETRVVLSDQKKTDPAMAAPPSTTPPSSSNTSTPSPEAISSPAVTPYGDSPPANSSPPSTASSFTTEASP